jgi:aspartyl protease family protein
MLRPVLTFAALAALASIIVPQLAAKLPSARPTPAMMASAPAAAAPTAPDVPDTPASGTVEVPRNGDGHFAVEGRVDGRRLEFVVDTGASVVALSSADASSIGIHPAARDFTASVRTANGVVRAAPVKLDSIDLGDVTVRDVDAMVLPDGTLSDNLLGLSFLSRLKRYQFSVDKLVLEQ